MIINNFRLSSLPKKHKLVLFALLMLSSLTLALLTRTDQEKRKREYFIKENSPYFSFFSGYFKDKTLIKALEKDITGDKKAEFVFVFHKANCSSCSNDLVIFQGEKEIFRVKLGGGEVILKDNGFVLKNGKTRTFQWTGSDFREAAELTGRV